METSRVGKAIMDYFEPPEESVSRRTTITVWGDVYESVQLVAARLGLSWAKAANLLLRGAAVEAQAWMERTGFQARYEGLGSPELLQALEDGPDSPMYREAMERTGLQHYLEVRAALRQGPVSPFYEQALAYRQQARDRRAETMRKAIEAGPSDPLHAQALREQQTGIVPEPYGDIERGDVDCRS